MSKTPLREKDLKWGMLKRDVNDEKEESGLGLDSLSLTEVVWIHLTTI